MIFRPQFLKWYKTFSWFIGSHDNPLTHQCFTVCLFIILLVQFGLLSGHLLGNSCTLG